MLAALGCTTSQHTRGPLARKMEQTKRDSKEMIPAPSMALLQQAQAELEDSGIADAARQPGDLAPDFNLPDAWGKDFNLAARLKQGPVVLTFYRGHW